MMLLLATASLIGISSSIYQPVNVETQPQVVPTTQIQRQPPIVTQQQQPVQPQGNPQSVTSKIITQQRAETLAQATADNQLLDRLFPQIIKRIDGKTLAQKVDAATLLQKIDARTLAAKVLPYLDNKVTLTPRVGEASRLTGTGPLPPSKSTSLDANCLPGEIAVSGGFSKSNNEDLKVSTPRIEPNPRTWLFEFYGGGYSAYAFTWVHCLKVESALKDVEKPQQQPSPPGGPPLQPPPNLR
jgi:hypothetical protein